MLHANGIVEGKEGVGVVCLAAEIGQLYYRPQLDLSDGSCVACRLRCCLDFAAVRGMRGVRGKGSAPYGCQEKEGRQEETGVEATWREAEEILRAHCSFNLELMHYESVRSAVHIPPEDSDCPHCNKDVFSSRDEFEDAHQAGLAALKASYLANDENKEAAAAYDKITRDHS
eukprot:6193584-Pleurochrysis_carterae.AAC.7